MEMPKNLTSTGKLLVVNEEKREVLRFRPPPDSSISIEDEVNTNSPAESDTPLLEIINNKRPKIVKKENYSPIHQQETNDVHPYNSQIPEEIISQALNLNRPGLLTDYLNDPNYALKDSHEQVYLDPVQLIKSSQDSKGSILPQVLSALAVSLCSLIIGFGSAYTSPALPSMAHKNSTLFIPEKDQEASWIGSLLPLGALLGSIVGGLLIDLIGRKRTILSTSIPFILSWLLIGFAENVWMIYIARGITGFCVGLASLTLPVYLAEMIQPEIRGMLGLLPTTIGNSGIVIAYAAGMLLDWRYLAYLGAILSLPFLIFSIFIPETPRWLISKNRDMEAQKALQYLRGSKANITCELKEIQNAHLESWDNKVRFLDIFSKSYIKPVMIVLALMFFQQLTGINAVIYYSEEIFKESKSHIDEKISTLIVGIVNFSATFICLLLIDKLGRRTLLILSDVGMIICLGGLSMYYFFDEDFHKQYDWFPLIGINSYILAFGLGFGPVPWLLMGELLPGRIRSNAAAVATGFNWIMTFFVTKTFPEFLLTFGNFWTFLVFAVACIVCLVFIILFVPETQGLTLEDIEKTMIPNDRKFMRKMSSSDNFKPFPLNT